MAEHPIIFNSEMIRAILDGRKFQTRRVIKPQPPEGYEWSEEDRLFVDVCGSRLGIMRHCPYGRPGDRLWVREAWAVDKELDDRPPRALEWLTANEDFPVDTIYYRADCSDPPGISPRRGKWRPSIHMPRWASRITLEITGVRVERVQDISEEDAEAEGCVLAQSVTGPMFGTFRGAFSRLWDSINLARRFGWDRNPWCWCISFKRIDKQT